MSLVEQLKRHEGWRAKPYIDTVGVPTFGYGFTYLTEEEGEQILQNRIATCKADLVDAFPWTRKLDPVRFNVLVNMTYNLGINRLSQFVNTLKAVEEGRYDDAVKGMLASKWATQVHGRAIELAKQMQTGEE